MGSIVVEPAAIKFYYESTLVLQCYMDELRLFLEGSPGVNIGIGVTNPTSGFDIQNYIFMKNLRGMTEKMSFQLTNPGYNNEPYSFVPIGSIVIWGGATIPENWLECTGQLVKQVVYPLLYTALGVKYTSTDNQNANSSKVAEEKLFQVPDFRGGVGVINRTSSSQAIGTRYPTVDGKLDANVNIETEYAPLRKTLIQEFILKSTQLPPHRHLFKATQDINGNTITRYAMKDHTHTITRSAGARDVTSGAEKTAVYYTDAARTTTAGTFTHTHTVTNIRLLEAYNNNKNDSGSTKPTWNDPFSIEQQYIIMRYIIKAA